MLTVDQISRHFPVPLRQRNPQGMLVEYLQYELLDSLFKNPGAAALSFIGGTAIRILHDSHRFSEDIERPLHNCIKPAILSFRRKPESSIIKYFLDSGSSTE